MFSVEHLNALRAAEIEHIAGFFRPKARVLEVGAGTGVQSRMLRERGFEVTAIEIASSNYVQDRVFPITEYDGKSFPLPDASVDIVFSSNVLEHVPDLSTLHAEARRVLRPDGYCVHVLPTHAWRFWTTLSSYPTALQTLAVNAPQLAPHSLALRKELPRLADAWYRTARRIGGLCLPVRHGERGNAISELWLFNPDWWRRNFRANQFEILHEEPMGLFYTGNMLLGPRLSREQRAKLSRWLGSACHLFKIAPLGASKSRVGG
jgi:SAM-dependent methyltransferase